MNGVQGVNPTPTKRPCAQRDAEWAQAKAMQFREVGRDPQQCQTEYWMDWLAGCRAAGLGAAGIRQLEQLISPHVSDSHAMDVIAAILTLEGCTGAAAQTIAMFVRATGRHLEEPDEPFVDDDDYGDEELAS